MIARLLKFNSKQNKSKKKKIQINQACKVKVNNKYLYFTILLISLFFNYFFLPFFKYQNT